MKKNTAFPQTQGLRGLLAGLCTLFVGLSCLALTTNAQTQYRTVIDKEPGSVYQSPEGFPWTDFGYADGSPTTLDPAAIRVLLAFYMYANSGQDNVTRGFPYSKLRAYEAHQVAEGKPPIFVTATYNGKKRPVIWQWSLRLQNGKPTAPSNMWQYAINVQDPRYIHFWLNEYVQPMVAKYQLWGTFGPNLWFHLDNGTYLYSLWGVLDDNNNFVPGVTWDLPFPQNQTEFETALETFFAQIKAQAPNINTIVNVGSQVTPSHFPQLFANVGGGMTEDLYSWHSQSSAYSRNLWYTQNIPYFTWLAAQNRVTTLRSEIPSSDQNGLMDSFALYSLLKGQNSFFAVGNTSGYALDPADWVSMKSQLGYATGAMQASAANSKGVGYRLYSRQFQGGIVYLNGTGSTQTIQLNPNITYYSPSGQQLTSHSIQLADVTGTYVTTSPNALPQPRISPRYGAPSMGPLLVTLESDTPGATIRYTLDGSTPTSSSTQYTTPITVSQSRVVTARAFYGSESSLPSSASYTISTSALTAQFHLSSDSGLAGTYYPVVSLSAIPNDTVEVFFSVSNGSPTAGSYKFLPGMTYGILPITTGTSGTTTITLTGATGAVLGSNQTLSYDITN